MIVNLALFFAYHVLWPQGWAGPFDIVAAVITVAATLALVRWQVGVIPLLLVCAAAGVLLRGLV